MRSNLDQQQTTLARRRYGGGWVQLIYFVVTLILSIVLAPKPPSPKPAMLEDFDLPVAEEDRAIPWLFGRARFTGANVVWFGDLDIQKIRKSSFLGGSQVTGFKYFLGLHLILGYTLDRILAIDWGDKSVWTGDEDANTTIFINKADVFGGNSGEGGAYGKVDFMFGHDDQDVNEYLLGRLGAPLQAHLAVTGLVFRGANTGGDIGTPFDPVALKFGGRGKGFYVGNTPYVKPIAVSGERIFGDWQGDDIWYPETAQVDSAGMNPAHIAYQVITDAERGQGSPVAMLDDTSYRSFADLCIEESLGLDLLWNATTPVEDFLQIVADHTACIFAYDMLSGKYIVRPVRGDYDVDALQSFDPSNVIKCENYQRRSWGETVNELTIMFTDPVTLKSTGIIVQDLGNIRSQNVRIPEKIDRSGIRDPQVIRVVAGRELAARATPLSRCDITLNRIGFGYIPGDVIILAWPEYKLAPTVMRVIDMNVSPLGDGFITASLVEDIYALAGIEYTEHPVSAEPEAPPATPPDTSTPGGTVSTTTQTTPPSFTARVDGERHLVPATVPVDSEWYGHEGEVAEWDADNEEWIFLPVAPGTIIYDEESGAHVAIGQSGQLLGTPWTPETGALTIDGDPDGDTSYLPVLTSDGYRRVALRDVRAGDISASDVDYDDSVTDLGADNVQGAIMQLVSNKNGSIVWVRGFVDGLFRGQAGLDFLDSPDGLLWTVRATQYTTNLRGIFEYAGKFWNNPQNGIGFATDIYGAWTYTSVIYLPTRNLYGGYIWSGLKRLDGQFVMTSNFPVPGVIATSPDGTTWTDAAEPVGLDALVGDEFWQVTGVFEDVPGARFLVFWTKSKNITSGGGSFPINQPQVYESTDLVNFTKIADLLTSPTTQSATITDIVQRLGADALPSAYRYLMALRSVQELAPSDSIRVTHEYLYGSDRVIVQQAAGGGVALRKFNAAGVQIDNVGLSGSGSFVYHAFRIAGIVYVSWLNAGTTQVDRVDLASLTVTHSYSQTGPSNVFNRASYNGAGIFLINGAGDIIELDASDLTPIGSPIGTAITPAATQRTALSATHIFVVTVAYDVIKIALADGSTSATIVTDASVAFVWDIQVDDGWLYVASATTVTRYSTSSGTQDGAFLLNTSNADAVALSIDGDFLGTGTTQAAAVVVDLASTGLDEFHGTLWGVAMELQTDISGPARPFFAHLARSDDGDTWTFPAPTWPNNTKGLGLGRLIWDGTRFIVSGYGFTGVSPDLSTWTFSDPDFEDSGIVETAFYLDMYSDSDGTATGVAINANGRIAQSASSDGLVWIAATPQGSIDAIEVAYDNGASGLAATNVQAAIDELAAGGGGGASDAADVTFAPAGTIVAVDVQAAIEELDADRVSNTSAIAGIVASAGAPSGLAVLDAGGRLVPGEVPLLVPIADATTSHTITSADYFEVTRFTSATLITLLVPNNSTLAVPIGTVCAYKVAGAGMVQVTEPGGVTLNFPSGKSNVTSATGAFLCLHNVATNTWDITGDLA